MPGDPNTSTGGYIYDAQILAGLAELGWRSRVHSLDASFPRPTPAALRDARERLAALPATGVVLIDGLALAGLERVLDTEAKRLAVVALVHHPLALETGIATADARLLETAERNALTFARRVIVTSQWTARALGAYGVPIERIRVVEPGVDRRAQRVARASRAAGAGGPSAAAHERTTRGAGRARTSVVARGAGVARTARADAERPSRDAPEDHPWGSGAHIPVRARSRDGLSTSARAVTDVGGHPSGGTVRMLCVATVTPRKGHAVLLEALAELRDRTWHLTCAGSITRDAETFAALERQVERLAIGARVSFLGDLDADALEREYARADLFVLASYLEGYGMALAEAVARGIPVVSTTAGAIPETVPAAAGVLVPPGDSRALAKALALLLDDVNARMQLAANARAAAATLPTWRAAAEKFAAALDGVAPPARAR